MTDPTRDYIMVSFDRLETDKGRDCKVCIGDNHGYEESSCSSN
jgi:hypothetical protein